MTAQLKPVEEIEEENKELKDEQDISPSVIDPEKSTVETPGFAQEVEPGS